MITFSRLGKKGNIGNQLFQIASVIGIAKANKQDFAFPKWKYSEYFENELPIVSENDFIHFQEQQYHFEPVLLDDKNYDLEGWFQSEKYFKYLNDIKHYFKFKEELVVDLKRKYELLFTKKTILISIRRGDFVDHKDYFQLPINFYLTALIEHFPHFTDCNILVLSDDVKYCQYHFSSLDNVFFADKMDAVQQLILASLCDDFIISNSTFSWWCAWLGEKENSKIIRPIHNFSLQKRESFDDKDYFPDRWLFYDFKNKKIDLSNVIFVLKKRDSIVESYLKQNFIFSNQDNLYSNIPLPDNITKLVYINDTVPSPVVIYICAKLSKSTVYYANGKLIKISRLLDLDVFTKQFDFGIFARLIDKKDKVSNKIVLVYYSIENKSAAFLLNDLKKNKLKINPDFHMKFCFSGRIIDFFQFKYFLLVKVENWIYSLEKDIKKRINYKKK